MGFPVVSDGKNLPAVQKTGVPSLGWEDLLEKGMATHYPFQYFYLQKFSLWKEVFSRHTIFYVKIIYFENRFYVRNHLLRPNKSGCGPGWWLSGKESA